MRSLKLDILVIVRFFNLLRYNLLIFVLSIVLSSRVRRLSHPTVPLHVRVGQQDPAMQISIPITIRMSLYYVVMHASFTLRLRLS
jgi:hypothetical protein